jgi:hypothetical protein
MLEPDAVHRRACGAIGQRGDLFSGPRGHDPLAYNCEQFARWCKTGQRWCRQLEQRSDKVLGTVATAAQVASVGNSVVDNVALARLVMLYKEVLIEELVFYVPIVRNVLRAANGVCSLVKARRDLAGTKVRKPRSWPSSWANFSRPLSLYQSVVLSPECMCQLSVCAGDLSSFTYRKK